MTAESTQFKIGDRVSISEVGSSSIELATIVFASSGTYLLNNNTYFQEVITIHPCNNWVICCTDDDEMENVRSKDRLTKIASLTVEELLIDSNPFIHQAGLRLFKEQNDSREVP